MRSSTRRCPQRRTSRRSSSADRQRRQQGCDGAQGGPVVAPVRVAADEEANRGRGEMGHAFPSSAPSSTIGRSRTESGRTAGVTHGIVRGRISGRSGRGDAARTSGHVPAVGTTGVPGGSGEIVVSAPRELTSLRPDRDDCRTARTSCSAGGRRGGGPPRSPDARSDGRGPCRRPARSEIDPVVRPRGALAEPRQPLAQCGYVHRSPTSASRIVSGRCPIATISRSSAVRSSSVPRTSTRSTAPSECATSARAGGITAGDAGIASPGGSRRCHRRAR